VRKREGWKGRVVPNSLRSVGDDYEPFFNGEKLYGDDFSQAEITEWFKDEERGYYELLQNSNELSNYAYHALNWYHGFRFLSHLRFRHILGFGSAYGEELRPVLGQAQKVTILEPGPDFSLQAVGGKAVEYVRPNPDGIFPFPDQTFDLIVCLSVLHHIPNVSTVIHEMARTAAPDAHLLIREPVVSMGDWRKRRKALTMRERGIPADILRTIIRKNGLEIQREAACMFTLTSRLNYVMRKPVFNSSVCTIMDAFLSRLPIWPSRYHPKFFLHKLRPSAAFYLLRKPGQQLSCSDNAMRARSSQ
jgi:SAM-dependent methyltransferase